MGRDRSGVSEIDFIYYQYLECVRKSVQQKYWAVESGKTFLKNLNYSENMIFSEK